MFKIVFKQKFFKTLHAQECHQMRIISQGFHPIRPFTNDHRQKGIALDGNLLMHTAASLQGLVVYKLPIKCFDKFVELSLGLDFGAHLPRKIEHQAQKNTTQKKRRDDTFCFAIDMASQGHAWNFSVTFNRRDATCFENF